MKSGMSTDAGNARNLPFARHCFVCGEENPAGLKVRFYTEDGLVKTRWHAQPHHCGYENVVHGGVTAAVMDECMGWAAARATGRMCVTGELTVRYLLRVPGDRELVVAAETVRASRLLAHVKATLTDAEGMLYARAEGRFAPISVEETLAVDNALIYQGGEERMFDALRAARKPSS
jgi:uncharacterized protein (TIGR00369 family)